MTVNVRRVGPPPRPTYVDYIDCSRCGSELEYVVPDDVQVDGFKVSGFFFAGTAKVKQKSFITCPHCGEAVFV